MGESFVLGGDPGSIRGSATVWSTFGQQTSGAAGDIRGLDTSSFVGDEADLYRSKVNEDLPPRLDTTSTAWGVVASALRVYAGTLEDLQSRMSVLRARAAQQESAVSDAQSDLTAARSADAAHTRTRQQAERDLQPGQTLPADTYRAQTSGASTSLSSAQSSLQATIDAAATLRSEHETALNRCCGEIDRAKEMRFADPPGFWGKLTQSVGDWISEHADVLTAISSVLKTISGIAGMLALIPCLTPIMGPIALATGGTALLIDVGVKLATGEGSWLQIGVDAMSMIPGMRAAKLAFGAEVGLTSYNVATGNASVSDLVMVVGMGALGNSRAVQNRIGYEVGAARAGWSEARAAVPSYAMPGGMSMPTGGIDLGAMSVAFRSGRGSYVHPVTVDSVRYPQSAQHIRQAQGGMQWRGSTTTPDTVRQPRVLTIDRGGARGRRAESTGQVAPMPASTRIQRDEYPPAMFAEGGADASVKYVNGSDNGGAGASIGNQVRGLPNGASVRIDTTAVPPDFVVPGLTIP